MKKIFIIFLLFSFLIFPLVNDAVAYVNVKGYYRSDGTYVKPHVRSNPNGLKYDNYSYKTSQGLYNDSYGTKGSDWDTPTWSTDPNYYTGKSLYESGNHSVTVKESESTNSDAQIDTKLSNRLKGKLLLQVEQGGAIWYVDPNSLQRYSVTWANALALFRKLALGINDSDLSKIPAKGSSNTGSASMRERLKGKLLLQVQQGGAIWYVDDNGYRHSVTWNNLMPLFQSLALGITNADLAKIPIGSLE